MEVAILRMKPSTLTFVGELHSHNSGEDWLWLNLGLSIAAILRINHHLLIWANDRKGMLKMQKSRTTNSLSIFRTLNQCAGMILTLSLFLFTSFSLSRRTPVVSADSMRPSSSSTRLDCKPRLGPAAYMRLIGPTAPTSPRQLLRASFSQDDGMGIEGSGGSQWCYGQSCQHNLMVCDPGAFASPTSGCCVVCCWENNPSNCSAPACCTPK